MDRDIEILKIEVLADYYHNQSNLSFSFLLAFLVGFILAFLTLVLEGRLSLEAFYLAVVLAFGFVSYELHVLNKRYSEGLNRISDLLKQVENGETLPSLNELRKMKT